MKKLYRLQDGTQADPKDCSTGKDGILRHKDGLAVAVGENGEPETIEAKAEGKPAAAEAADKPAEKF